ncbi:MAG: hypothetical protein HOC20_13480 [Chloroflexi bacterium]|nr:hypothetical protein [Chloroflexota bacterium]
MNPECLVPGKDGEVIFRKGEVIDKHQFERMKDEFYGLRGWDIATGFQSRQKVTDLRLKDVAQKLSRNGLAT